MADKSNISMRRNRGHCIGLRECNSLVRPINLGKEVETLRSQMAELPEVETQLMEVKSANALLQTVVYMAH